MWEVFINWFFVVEAQNKPLIIIKYRYTDMKPTVNTISATRLQLKNSGKMSYQPIQSLKLFTLLRNDYQ